MALKKNSQQLLFLILRLIKYRALSNLARETVWLMSLLKDLGFKKLNLMTIFCNNEGSMKLVYNPIFHFKTKHITIHYHFVKEKVENKEIQVQCRPTTEQIAKLLIKLLGSLEMLFILLVLKTKCIKG